jgi:hypothetical protein
LRCEDDAVVSAHDGAGRVPETAMTSAGEHWDPLFEVPAGYANDFFRLDGRVAAVTGGGSGLGAAIAKGLAQADAALAIVDVTTRARPEPCGRSRSRGDARPRCTAT